MKGPYILCVSIFCILNLFEDVAVHASFNGEYRSITDFPYLAQLESGCGGAIISADWVITAAHCVGRIEGETKIITGSSIALEGGKLWNVSKIFVHGDWFEKGYDICLLKLETPIDFNKYQQPIRIARYFTPEDGDNVTFAGYGSHHHAVNGIALRSAQVPVVEHKDCSNIYEKRYSWKVPDTEFCTSTKEVELCPGDSGSPAVFNNELIGVLALGCTKAENAEPSGFTKLASYYDWIMEITGIKYDN